MQHLYTVVDVNGDISRATHLFEATNRLILGARGSGEQLPISIGSHGKQIDVIGSVGCGPGEIDSPLWTAPLAGDTIRVFMPGCSADYSIRSGFLRERLMRSATPINALLLFPSGTHVVNSGRWDAPVGRDVNPFEVRDADGQVLTPGNARYTRSSNPAHPWSRP